MTALIVIAAVALVLFILLASSLTVDFEYDESFSFKVKYLFFTIIMNPNSPRRIKRKEKKEAKKKKKEEKKREKEKKQALKKQQASPQKNPKSAEAEEKAEEAPSEKGEKKDNKKQEQKKDKQEKKKDKEKNKVKLDLDLIISIIKKASPHVKRIFKKIRFYNIVVDITVGGDDAAKVAISYGAHCSAVYSLVAFLQNTVTFKAKMIDVKCNFNLEKTDYYASGTVKLRLSTLLHSAIWGACAVLLEIYKANKAQPKVKVSGKNQKSQKSGKAA